MAELFAKLNELRNLPTEQHWFCPLHDHSNDQEGDHDSPASIVDVRCSSEEDVAYRKKLVTDSLQLYAYDGEDVLPHQEYLQGQIDRQLGKCDLCIVQYYRARLEAMEALRSEYLDDDVTALGKLFDGYDINRINRGLEDAVQRLQNTAPEHRSKDVLPTSSQLAIFEALSSQTFLADPNLVEKHLDEPFRLIQTNKRLRVARYVPAATIFLFDTSQEKCFWAMQAWSKLPSPITKEDFDFAVRDPLLKILKTASEPITDFSFNQRLWYGVRQIIEKLDNELITHSLRAMEIDLFRIALEHLQYKTPAFRFLMQTMQMLLEIAPKDYWDSMGAISPTTVIEQVFNNPQYDQFVQDAMPDEDFEKSALKDMLSWIKPFLASLQVGHQAQACRSLTFQLIDRLQANRFPSYARTKCYHTGLEVLIWALENCNKSDMISKPVSQVVAVECLEVTSIYMTRILEQTTFSGRRDSSSPLVVPCLATVKAALTLECKILRTDKETIREKIGVPPRLDRYSDVIWGAVVQRVNSRNVLLTEAALAAIAEFPGLEKFRTDLDNVNLEAKTKFNQTLSTVTHRVCEMLERVNDFSPNDLDELYRNPDTSVTLFAALLSPHASTHDAAADLIKNISSELGRREAMRHLLLSFFDTTLSGLSLSIRWITRRRSFTRCPNMLKTCTDTLEALGDYGSGVLRTRPLSGAVQVKALENFWEQQWQALKVIYEMTEEWGKMKVQDVHAMREFCRDTMNFSDRLFDQYSLYASAINSALSKKDERKDKSSDAKAGKELLRLPASAMEVIVQWLKLRDVQLAGTAVNLTKKVLNRLTEWGMKVDEAPRELLGRIIHNQAQGRTHLTPQEKAELARALEANLGYSISPPDTDQEQSHRNSVKDSKTLKTRTGTIDLQTWKSKAKSPANIVDISDDDEFGDSDVVDQDILAASRSVELLKEQKASRSSSSDVVHVSSLRATLFKPEKKVTKLLRNDPRLQADQLSFREKREKERAAKKKRDAEALAIVKKRAAGQSISENVIKEGSVLGQIGLSGKDHAPKTSSMMVSSDSESDSDEELDRELFGGGSKSSKVSDAVREYESSRMQQARAPQPVRKTKQLRSAKDMRARLAPDLVSLHRTILGWDFFHSGDFPPGSERQDYSMVTNVFRQPKDYQNTFEPLLVLEAWQGFLKSREEGNFKPFQITIVNRCTVDAFIEVSTAIPAADAKAFPLSEADIVLMSKAPSPTTDATQPHCLARIFKIVRKKNFTEIAYRVSVRNNLVPLMVPNATLFGTRIESLTPLEREYGALLGLQYFDLCDEIIKARPSPLLQYSEKQITPLVANYKINVAQAKAVKSAIDNDGFTLIQGPPGSGKTKTIVAIVGALMTSSFGDKGISINRPQPANSRQIEAAASKKLLICAPSNAAVDELVMRFKQGVKTTSGESRNLAVVRLGRSDAINTNVLDVTLEELVNARLNLASQKKPTPSEDVHTIMMTHKATCEESNILRAAIDTARANGVPANPAQEREFDVLKRKKQQLSNQIDSVRDSGEIVARNLEVARRKVQQEILDQAHVICATLSGSGHEMFQNLNIEFETVIIDEAAQSIELSALIPLKYGCSKCILVGDPKQLPPTVLSREAARFQYEQSLFVRMQVNHQNDVHLLDTQYRMHPEISVFPSKSFYDGKLLDGEGMATLRAKPWHRSGILGPYRFFDVQGAHQSAPRGHSLINIAEIKVALKLYERLTTDCHGYDFAGKVGIITPYKSQLRELRSRFAEIYGEAIFSKVEFNTTDAFQGRESEVIIFSCVRASATGGIGFLSDIRRMNVGITRAKSSLWVLGNSQSLIKGEFWGRLVQDTKSRNRYTEGDLLRILEEPLLGLGVESHTQEKGQPPPSEVSRMMQDVPMQDAPISDIVKIGNSNSRSRGSSAKQSPVDQPMADAWGDNAVKANDNLDADTQPSMPRRYAPSGGGNGLNPNLNCGKCGSSAHWTQNCDNEEAKKLNSDRCRRCNDSNHRSMHCTVKRCYECGDFGHTKETCKSTRVLSREAKYNIFKQEAAHRQLMSRAPDMQRKRQLGDHAKEIPKLRVATESPPPPKENFQSPTLQQNANAKRKREASPPSSSSTNKRKPSTPQLNDVNRTNPASVEKSRKKPLPDNNPKGSSAYGTRPSITMAHRVSNEMGLQNNTPKGLSADRSRPSTTIPHRVSNEMGLQNNTPKGTSADRSRPSITIPNRVSNEMGLPDNISKGPSADGPRPSTTMPHRLSNEAEPPRVPPPPLQQQSQQQQQNSARPPPIRRKKEVNMFIKPKPRR